MGTEWKTCSYLQSLRRKHGQKNNHRDFVEDTIIHFTPLSDHFQPPLSPMMYTYILYIFAICGSVLPSIEYRGQQ